MAMPPVLCELRVFFICLVVESEFENTVYEYGKTPLKFLKKCCFERETSLKLTMLWFIIRELLSLLLELQMHTTRSYFVWFWNVRLHATG